MGKNKNRVKSEANPRPDMQRNQANPEPKQQQPTERSVVLNKASPAPASKPVAFSGKGAPSQPLVADGPSSAESPAPVQAAVVAAAAETPLVPRSSRTRVRDEDVVTQAVMRKDPFPASWKRVVVVSNHCAVTLESDVYEYGVTFTPDMGESPKRKRIIARHGLPNYIFMLGNEVFTCSDIPEDQREWVASPAESGMPTPVSVRLTLVRHYPPGANVLCTVLVALVESALRSAKYERIQRNFFDPSKKIRVGEKYEVMPGIIVSFMPATIGFSLVCDTTHKIARTGTVLDMWRRECAGDNPERKKDHFCKQMIDKVVTTVYNNWSYIVKRVDRTMNPNDVFELGDGTKISYAKYIYTRYGCRLTTVDQPMLVCERKGRVAYLIPEFCQPTGIDENDRKNNALMMEIADVISPAPREKHNQIEDAVKLVSNNIPKFAKMNISPPKQVNVYVIPTPKLPPMRAREALSPRNKVLKEGALPLERLLVVRPRSFDVRQLVSVVVDGLGKIGITGIKVIQLDWDWKVNAASMKATKPDFVLFVLPSKDDRAYRSMKIACYHDLCVPCQGVLMKNLSNPRRALIVMENLTLQIAVKLGRVAWKMPFIPSTKDMMVFGLDVCHTTPIHKSVVGMVATLDDSFGKFVSDFAIQERGKEIVENLRAFVIKALNKYKKKRGAFPKKIMFLRDGVGDDQLQQVNDVELSALLDVVRELCPATKVTFIVVKKRIPTRVFFNGGNPVPGTLITSEITHPNWYDFFLVSHETRKGTVSPTHYNVLIDQIGWPISELVEFIFLQCHQYFNWSGSISVPAPCQYAHRVAFLYGRSLLAGDSSITEVPEDLEETLFQI